MMLNRPTIVFSNPMRGPSTRRLLLVVVPIIGLTLGAGKAVALELPLDISTSSDGKRISVLSLDSGLNVYDLAFGKLIRQLVGDLDFPFTPHFSPEGRRIVAGSSDHASVWNIETGKTIFAPPEKIFVRAAKFSPNGNFLGTVGPFTQSVFSAATSKLLSQSSCQEDEIQSIEWSPNSQFLLTSSWDTTCKILNAKTGSLIRTIESQKDRVYTA
jgi:WD40 repeat protein